MKDPKEMTLDAITSEMLECMEAFKVDCNKSTNKAAAARCRKNTLRLDKLGKAFRAKSLK